MILASAMPLGRGARDITHAIIGSPNLLFSFFASLSIQAANCIAKPFVLLPSCSSRSDASWDVRLESLSSQSLHDACGCLFHCWLMRVLHVKSEPIGHRFEEIRRVISSLSKLKCRVHSA